MTTEPNGQPEGGYAFGRYRLLPERQALLVDEKLIRIGDRALNILQALVEARGNVVGKDALMARAWPGQPVDENNLHFQISALRAALGADRGMIRTVARRGYQLLAEIQTTAPPSHGQAEIAESPAVTRDVPPTNLPKPISELVGRDQETREIARLANDRRLLTLTGPGGIGKTRLAIAAAWLALEDFPDGVWFVDLSLLSDPDLLPVAVASVAGIASSEGPATTRRIVEALTGRRVLLVLDTCEHMVDDAAAFAEAALQAGPGIHIIATSREALRAEGEWVYPVPSLDIPSGSEANPWRYSAVQLFVSRARASGADMREDARTALVIVGICRRLDGIPLAIELAAARASALGTEQLAVLLQDRFNLLTSGRRTALPRHQTLRATLDWSHELLEEMERIVLRRIAIFAGNFCLEAVSAVVNLGDLTPLAIVEGLSVLVSKSLVRIDMDGADTAYQLLDITRAYALEKLDESGERGWLARRHAEYYRDLFERADTERAIRSTAEWRALYSIKADNGRAALDWAFSPEGDAVIGVTLAVAMMPLWLDLSLSEESRYRLTQARTAVLNGTKVDAGREAKIYAALGLTPPPDNKKAGK